MQNARWMIGWALAAAMLFGRGHAWGAVSDTILSGCAEIATSGVYHLDRDITGNAGSGCLRIHDTADVTLNCHGHAITTDASALAALVVETVKNFTIDSCFFPQVGGYSLFVGNSVNGTVTRNTIKDMIVHMTDAGGAASMHVVANRFENRGTVPEGNRPFATDEIGFIPIEAGLNRIEASLLSVPVLPGPPDTLPGFTVSTPEEPRVYPNPWMARRDPVTGITFDHLPANSTIQLYTVSAHWVRTLQAPTGDARWDLRNADGEAVASGYYLYLIQDKRGWKHTGKLAVIR